MPSAPRSRHSRSIVAAWRASAAARRVRAAEGARAPALLRHVPAIADAFQREPVEGQSLARHVVHRARAILVVLRHEAARELERREIGFARFVARHALLYERLERLVGSAAAKARTHVLVEEL